MRVGTSAADSTLDNAMSEHGLFGLTRDEAYDQIKKVCAVVRGWNGHFVRLGVNQADIATLERQIDRPFLSDQRRAFA